MTEEKIKLAIFDFDGTLTSGHLWLGIAKHHSQKRVKRRSLALYIFSHMPYWIAVKLRLYSEEKNRSRWGEGLSVLFKGFKTDEAQKAFEWVTDHYFMPLMRPDVMKVLQGHKDNDHKVMLLSGMFTDFLQIVGQRIGADYVVGTRLEIAQNIYTGRIIQPLCFGENKARLLKEFIQQNQLNVDFSGSAAYADSFYDLPVFKLVGHPVATYADTELGKLANQEGWERIGE